jgi:hypothetical protein
MLLVIFRWLIHVETLCDPLDVIICNTLLNKLIKMAVCTRCRGWVSAPFQKRRRMEYEDLHFIYHHEHDVLMLAC